MPYIKPGAYAQFVPTGATVNNAGASRVMAIIGTGTMTFDVTNEGVSRSSAVPFDTLANSNVYEVASITSKAPIRGYLPTGTITWVQGKHFTLADGQNIVWYTDKPATATKDATVGNADLAGLVTVIVDGTNGYKVPTNKYKIEVTFVDPTAGAYRVIDEATNAILGEYAVSNVANTNAIPGVDLTITSTFHDDGSGNSTISVGDYVVIDTVQAEVPANYVDNSGATPITTALPQPGQAYYVSYSYKKDPSQFGPQVFFSYDDVVATYGPYNVTASGVVINSLSLGAYIAFQNGVSTLVCVQAQSNNDFEMMASIDQLRIDIPGIHAVNTIVPLTTSKTVGSHLMNHIMDMSSEFYAKECMGYLAAQVGEAATASVQAAQAYDNERIVYVVPGSAYTMVKDPTTGNVNERLVDASYLAVAVASIGLANDPATPLTNKAIAGFTRLGMAYEESEMNDMGGAGCLILKANGPVIKIRHGMTTNTDSADSNEITLVQIKDYVIDAVRTTLGDTYIGNKLSPTIVADVQTTLQAILNSMISQQIILGFTGVKVKQDANDPRALDINFQISAIYPLNWIYIQFGFTQ